MVRSLELGEWGPGDAIPSESELAARFSVSQGTVRKAIDEMAAENLLVRRQGKGTFVSTHNDPRSLFRFLRLQPNEGEIDQSISEPVECWRAKAGQDVSRVLGLAVGTPITILRRLLSFDGEPALVDEIYLPSDLFPDLSLDVLQHNDMSLYRLYENRYGVRMQGHAGVFRFKELLHEGVEQIAKVAERVQSTEIKDKSKVWNTARSEALELENLIEVAKATMSWNLLSTGSATPI